jgi:protein-S-isoprenylcysteine O-methyltransferase Ste14
VRIAAERVLGAHFSRHVQVIDEASLVTDGPYRWLRHPAYRGALACWLGSDSPKRTLRACW